MDSQDNIILEYFNKPDKNISIPIPDKPNKSILFSVKEYDDVSIINDSLNYDIFIEDLDNGREIRLSYREKQIINELDHPNPALEYRIRILNKKTGESNLFFYRIAHTDSTNDLQYKNMICSIAQFDENLLYEQDTKYLSGRRIYNSSYRSLYVLLLSIINNKTHILYSLNSIFNNPVLRDKKEIYKSDIEKKQSPKSIIKNAISPQKNNFYSYEMRQYADFSLNQYLLFLLIFSKKQLEVLKEKATVELAKNKEKHNSITAKANPDKSKRKKHTNYQIGVFEKRIGILNNFIDTSLTILNSINRVLNLSVFNDVEPIHKRDNSISFNPNYLNVERKLFVPLYQGFAFNFGNNYSTILASPIKQTSKLFEAYCLLILDEAILELGFDLIQEETNYDHIVKRYSKDDYKVEIMYEINAKDVSKTNKNEIFTINYEARHVSPDFCLVLKKNEIPICFLVFDSKCRKAKSVHKSIVHGDYQKTIREYLSLRYSTDDNPFNQPKIVNSLWLVMPDNNEMDYGPAFQLEYKLCKLQIDGQEDNFVSLLDDYLLSFLD